MTTFTKSHVATFLVTLVLGVSSAGCGGEKAGNVEQADQVVTPSASEPAASTPTASPDAANTDTVAQEPKTQTGDLKITFQFKGEIPILEARKTPGCGVPEVANERLIVNKKTKGIKDVVVYLYNNKRKGTELPEQPVPKRKLLLDNKNCRFEPHILLAQVGDVLEIRNSDAFGHNANIQFFNIQENFQIPPGQSKKLELKETEPSLMPISCSIHPWMLSHVLLVDHSFHGVSNEDGVLEIKGIPVGEKVVFKAWHETGTFKENIIVDGKEDEWKKNVLQIEIKEGMNDMGIVEVPVDNFKL